MYHIGDGRPVTSEGGLGAHRMRPSRGASRDASRATSSVATPHAHAQKRNALTSGENPAHAVLVTTERQGET